MSSYQKCMNHFLEHEPRKFRGGAESLSPFVDPSEFDNPVDEESNDVSSFENPSSFSTVLRPMFVQRTSTSSSDNNVEFKQSNEIPNSPIPVAQSHHESQSMGPRSVFRERGRAFAGGQVYRPIYCGADPANKPKDSINGSPLECYRKGFFYGKKSALFK